MLQTEHGREFYLAQAGENELLETVLYGETSLTETLDAVFDSLDKPDDDTKDLLLMIADHSDFPGAEELVEGFPYRDELEMLKELTKGMLRAGAAFITAVTGIIILPGAVPAAVMYLSTVLGMGGIGRGAWKGILRYDKKISKAKEELLKPLYSAAASLDREIGVCFAPEHFRCAQPRFEETYRVLSKDEREAVDAQLHDYLGAGGMPGMDELQLKEYLGGLLKAGGGG